MPTADTCTIQQPKKKGEVMTELKCPFCNTPLVHENMSDYWCVHCNTQEQKGLYGSDKLWQALIDTKKKLDRAIWWLNEIVENHRFTPISTAEKALKELKQKEEK